MIPPVALFDEAARERGVVLAAEELVEGRDEGCCHLGRLLGRRHSRLLLLLLLLLHVYRWEASDRDVHRAGDAAHVRRHDDSGGSGHFGNGGQSVFVFRAEVLNGRAWVVLGAALQG